MDWPYQDFTQGLTREQPNLYATFWLAADLQCLFLEFLQLYAGEISSGQEGEEGGEGEGVRGEGNIEDGGREGGWKGGKRGRESGG